MLRLFMAAMTLLALAAAYIAAPFHVAWSIREAVTAADTEYMQRKVDWPAVRETMRQSMLQTALDLPEPGPGPDPDAAEAAAAAPRPGLWTRMKNSVKSYAGRRVVDKMVASYVSAEGLPKLYRQRQTAKAALGSAATDPADWKERFLAVWARVKRAEFKSLSALEIEIEDQFADDRSYVALLEFRRLEWIMTGLSVRSTGGSRTVAAAR